MTALNGLSICASVVARAKALGRSFLPSSNVVCCLGVLAVLVFMSAASAKAACSNNFTPQLGPPLHMLVIGDSIMWGQGLRDDEKFSSRVKCWLQEKLDRPVELHVEAHSGAVISVASSTQTTFTAPNGEVNLTTPTINEQLDQAIRFYSAQRAEPALVLMNGCINDVGVKNLLAASTPLDELRAKAQKSCGQDMQLLLQRVITSFPAAYVMVAGYYPIVSPQTDDNAFLRLLVKKLNSQRPETPRMTDKEMRQRLFALSAEWYKTSTASLQEAVTKANSTIARAKISFIEIDFAPEHVFAAPESLLWNFKFASTNVSGFARVIVLLSFGTAAYKPNDHVREIRVKNCEDTFKKPKSVKEDKTQKAARKDLFLICRYASLGHPNHMGALIYTEAIKGRLLPLINSAGWKRDTNSLQTLH